MKKILCFLFVVVLFSAFGVQRANAEGHLQQSVQLTHFGAYWKPHLSVDYSIGWRFNPYFYAGVATGAHLLHEYDYDSSTGSKTDYGWPLALPLFADVVGYLPVPNKNSAFYLGAELGGMYVFSQTQKPNPLWLLNAQTGFDIAINDRMGITVGIKLVTTGRVDYSGLALTTGFRF